MNRKEQHLGINTISVYLILKFSKKWMGYENSAQLSNRILPHVSNGMPDHLNCEDLDEVIFDSFMRCLRERVNTESDWSIIREKCSWYHMSPEVW